MAEHYFSNKPLSQRAPKQLSFEVLNRSFSFITDSGVFSKKEIDFGTNFLIETFCKSHIGVSGTILDVGCGYGVIGTVVGVLNPESVVHMVDVNERAVELSAKNARLNNAENVEAYYSDLLSQVSLEKVNFILSNPPIRAGKNVVYQLFADSYKRLAVGGELWIVIRKKQGSDSATIRLNDIFLEKNVTTVANKRGYKIICALK